MNACATSGPPFTTAMRSGAKWRATRLREELAGGRRRLGHLHQHAVAGGERRDHRAHGEVDRVVPGHDDADDAQRLEHDARAAGQEPEVGARAAAASSSRRRGGARGGRPSTSGEDLQQLRLVRRAAAEVAEIGASPARAALSRSSVSSVASDARRCAGARAPASRARRRPSGARKGRLSEPGGSPRFNLRYTL